MSDPGTSAYNLILGPIEAGHALNLFLFGILVVQAYQYFSTFDDPVWLKGVVVFILLLDTVQTGVMTFMVWDFTITHYNDPAHLAVPGWAIGTIPFWSVPIAWLVQGFFAWRIFQLMNRAKTIPLMILGLSVVQGLGGFGSGIGAFMVTSIADFPKLQPIAIVWFVGSILCDALITITMVIVLWRSRTGFWETDTLITKIIRSVVETGLSTTTIVILDAIFFFQMSNTNMHLCVVMIAGKTYSNSMLYTLNARSSLRRTTNIHATTAFTKTDIVFTNPQLKINAGTRSTATDSLPITARTRSGGIPVHRETVIDMEDIKTTASSERQSRNGRSLDMEESYVIGDSVDHKADFASSTTFAAQG